MVLLNPQCQVYVDTVALAISSSARLPLAGFLFQNSQSEGKFFFLIPMLRRPTPQILFDLKVLGSTAHKVHGSATPN